MQGLHKLRYVLAAHSTLVIRLCLVITLVSVASAGYTFAHPPTTEVTVTTESHTLTTAVDSRATVTRDSHLYSRGETLTNMPVYPRATAPTLSVSARTNPPTGAELQLTQRLTLVYEARTAAGEVFWERRYPLNRTAARSSGTELVSDATLNISAIDEQLGLFEAEVSDAGTVDVYLEVSSRHTGPEYTGSSTDRSEIRIRDGSYEIGDLSLTDELTTTERQRRPVASKVLRLSVPLFGSLVLPHTTLVLGFLGLAGIAGMTTTSVYAPRFDPARERAQLHKARYAEWISAGTLPSSLGNRAVDVETLEDLVDVALDSEKRIIHDASQGRYVVFDARTAYVYSEDADEPAATDCFDFPDDR